MLKSIDETNQNLLNLLDLYQDRVCTLAQEECIIGRFLRECSKVDSTKAGNLMSGSGKTLLFASHQFILLRNILIRIYRDVQTFQYRAVADTFDTVEQMEKSRTTYRAALLWMKDVSKQLDPDAYNQMDKFKKVQTHVRNTKKIFEKLKIDTIQKIDLLSASRCNLFSSALTSYQNSLQNIWSKTSKTMNIFVNTFKSVQGYEFTMLRELNDDSKDEAMESFENRLREIIESENINEKDMLIFFEADYKDDFKDEPSNGVDQKKKESKSSTTAKTSKTKAPNKANKSSKKLPSLLNFDTSSEKKNATDPAQSSRSLLDDLDISRDYMPSSLIDFEHKQKLDSEDLANQTDFEKLLSNYCPNQTSQAKTNPTTKVKTTVSSTQLSTEFFFLQKSDKDSTLESWLNLFSDIDPLANLDEFDRKLDTSAVDRSC